MNGGYNVDNIIDIVSCITGSISLVASAITIRLVLLMKSNGFLLVILSLAITQGIVSLGHCIIPNEGNNHYTHSLCNFKGFLLIFGELSAAFVTNVISMSVFYIVFIGRSFEIRKYYIIFLLICVGLPLAFAILAISSNFIHNSSSPTAACFLTPAAVLGLDVIYDDDNKDDISTLNMKITTTEAYDALHLMSLSFNVVVSICVLMNIILQNSSITDISYMRAIARISIFSTNSISSMVAGDQRSRKRQVIRTIALRLIFYPIAQIIVEVFRIADATTGNRRLSLMFGDELSSSLLGTAYFIIFVSMQPNASELLMKDIKRIFLCVNNSDDSISGNTHNDIQNIRVAWDQTSPFVSSMNEETLMEQLEIDDDTDSIRQYSNTSRFTTTDDTNSSRLSSNRISISVDNNL